MLDRKVVQEAVDAGSRGAAPGALVGSAFLHDSGTKTEASSR